MLSHSSSYSRLTPYSFPLSLLYLALQALLDVLVFAQQVEVWRVEAPLAKQQHATKLQGLGRDDWGHGGGGSDSGSAAGRRESRRVSRRLSTSSNDALAAASAAAREELDGGGGSGTPTTTAAAAAAAAAAAKPMTVTLVAKRTVEDYAVLNLRLSKLAGPLKAGVEDWVGRRRLALAAPRPRQPRQPQGVGGAATSRGGARARAPGVGLLLAAY